MLCFILLLFFHFGQSHNWVVSPRSRAIKASTIQPAPTRPSNFFSVRVGQGQEFGVEWATGLKKSEYFFVVLKATHEARLGQHSLSVLKAYIDQAPADARFKGIKWQKRHVSCGFSKLCSPKYTNTGRQYKQQLHQGDALFYDRPAVWDNPGSALFQYKPVDLRGDIRVSYENQNWPWIEAVHKFKVYAGHAYPREWDLAPFKIEGREGPGHYLIHMVWRGYRDVIDVDLLASPSPDIYGHSGSGSSTWSKINHCQYKTYDHKNNNCFFIDKSTRDVSRCLKDCKKHYKKCSAVNVVPLKNPEEVKYSNVNIPWESRNCDKNLAAKHDHENTLVCYGLQPKYGKTANKDVDAPWTVIPDDPEDPIFYSTCFNMQTDWIFEGFSSKNLLPEATPISYKVADMCLQCAAVEGISKLPVQQVPRWKLSRECSKCV